MTALWVALGGALGTLMRYGVTVGMARVAGVAWPFGTFTVNVLGSFGLAFLMELAPQRSVAGVDVRLVLGTGMLGGFTTYSSFNLETLRMAQQMGWGRASVYVTATLVVCFVGGLLGYALARWLRLREG